MIRVMTSSERPMPEVKFPTLVISRFVSLLVKPMAIARLVAVEIVSGVNGVRTDMLMAHCSRASAGPFASSSAWVKL